MHLFFRKKVRKLQGKERNQAKRQQKTLFATASKYLQGSGKRQKPKTSFGSEYLDRIAMENSLLVSGSGGGQLYHEQYDEHGVKIEHQCFS